MSKQPQLDLNVSSMSTVSSLELGLMSNSNRNSKLRGVSLLNIKRKASALECYTNMNINANLIT